MYIVKNVHRLFKSEHHILKNEKSKVIWFVKSVTKDNPVGTGRKLNVHKTFNLRLVFNGKTTFTILILVVWKSPKYISNILGNKQCKMKNAGSCENVQHVL